MSKSLSFIFITLIFMSESYGNGATFQPAPEGSGVVPLNCQFLQMIKEEVNIYKDITSCIFYVKNVTSEKVEFDMGFPFEIHKNSYLNLYRNPLPKIEEDLKKLNFQVFVNGKEAHVEMQTSSFQNYEYVFLWKITVPGNNIYKVVCEYKTPWEKFSADGGNSGEGFKYLRTPAKFWYGDVIEAHFFIHLDGLSQNDKPAPYMKIKPDNYYFNEENNTIEWHEYLASSMEDISFEVGYRWVQFKSDEEIDRYIKKRITDNFYLYTKNKKHINELMMSEFTSVRDIKAILDCFRTSQSEIQVDLLNRPWYVQRVLRVIRNYYYAFYGWQFKDDKLNRIFKDLSPKDKYRNYEQFPDFVKNNIRLIRNYEQSIK